MSILWPRSPEPTTSSASLAWRLSKALHLYFWHTRYLADWLESAQAGLAAAATGGDQQASAIMRLNLGAVHACLSHHDEAMSLYTAAYESALSADWLLGQQLCLANLGNLHIDSGELRAAQSCHRRVLALSQPDDRWQQQCASLTNLGIIAYQLGQLRQAEAHRREALRLARMHGHAGREAIALQFSGFTRHALGDLAGASRQLIRASDIHHSTGSRRGVGHTLMDLADLHRDTGRYDLAAELLEGALAVLRETGDLQSEALALNVRGQASAAHARGQWRRA